MLPWLNPGLLVTVTTPSGSRHVWFEPSFAVARMVDAATVARVMRLNGARSYAMAGLAVGWGVVLLVAPLLADEPSGAIVPLVCISGFAVSAGWLALMFTRAQRRNFDRQPELPLPPEAVARLRAVRARTVLGMKRQQDVACTVAAELVYRLG